MGRSLSEDMAAYGRSGGGEPPHPLLSQLAEVLQALRRLQERAASAGDQRRLGQLDVLIRLVSDLLTTREHVPHSLLHCLSACLLDAGVDPRNFERDRGR